MKKSILLYSAMFGLGLFAWQCNSKKTSSEVFENIDQYRTVWTGTDSVDLDPFEIFVKMQFKDFEPGMLDEHNYLKFFSEDTLAEYNYVIDHESEFIPTKGEVKDDYKWIGKSLTLKLYIDDEAYIERKIQRDQYYNVILSYKSDNSVARTHPHTDAFSQGYYIVDIVSPGQKFERQLSHPEE